MQWIKMANDDCFPWYTEGQYDPSRESVLTTPNLCIQLQDLLNSENSITMHLITETKKKVKIIFDSFIPFQSIYQVLLALKSTKYTLNPTTTTLIKASTIFPGNYSNSILPSLPASIFTFLLSVSNIDYKYLTLKNLMFEKNPNSFL